MADEVTLLELAPLIKTPLEARVVMGMFRGRLPSPIDFVPVKEVGALWTQTPMVSGITAPSTRNLNEAPAAYKVTVTDRQETVKIIQNAVRLDVVHLKKTKNYVEHPAELLLRVYGLSLKAKLNQLLVAGDPDSVDSEPAGLDYRLRNDAFFLNQSVNANGLDVDAGSAQRQAWLQALEEARLLCGGGAPDLLIVNRQTHIQLEALLRTERLWDTTRDQFDREITMYHSAKVVDAGQKPESALTSTPTGQVIGDDTATSIFGTANSTPVYFVSTQGEDGLRQLQLQPLQTDRLGVNPHSTNEYVISILATFGIYTPSPFCISSVQGLDIT